ncbi:MAG: hypothetical protein WC291_07465 [Thermodesulfovibrionales bacterium]|jgi:PHD/YefM family antitoxin component YafN of YafNO toxin-antitoxin module
MNTIPAQEIKRKGISAVDPLLEKGAVHVIKNNKPTYVVISEESYQELMEAYDEAYIARVKASLEDVKKGRTKSFQSVDELMKAIEAEAE